MRCWAVRARDWTSHWPPYWLFSGGRCFSTSIGRRICNRAERSTTSRVEPCRLMRAFPMRVYLLQRRCCALLLLLTATARTTAAGAESILAPAGPIGTSERIIILDALAIMLAIVIPTIVA